MARKFNVLVFPGGTEIGLEIHKALCQCKDVNLFSAGADVSSHAPFVYTSHFTLPTIHESGWIEALNEVIVANAIDYIFPAYDDIIVALALNEKELKAKIVTSPLETCLITRSKSATYRKMDGCIPTPFLYANPDTVDRYPVFVKPDKGQGAQDTYLVKDKETLCQLLSEKKDLIITEYLPGEEYTVDCFSDREAGLLFCSGRARVRTKSGISMSSKVVAQQEAFVEYARRISERLAFHGAWFYQVKKDVAGVYRLLEIAPRIAGTMALHRVQGVNFPLLSIYERERMPVSILKNPAYVEIDRALVNRYQHGIDYRTVYVDLDDTLILNDRVNVPVLAFLYQCLGEAKKIVLITKHAGDLAATLKKFRIATIFDEIIHLRKEDAKSDYIEAEGAILLDDSFSERKAANERSGILTFDCSMVEMLLDDRQ